MNHTDPTINRVTEWAAHEDSVRAVFLIGSRAEPDATLDALSDYDFLLFLTNDSDLPDREDWIEAFGSILVQLREKMTYRGREIPARLVQYRDGLRIDFTLAPVDMLIVLADEFQLPPWLDAGYRILLDKANLAAQLGAPSGRGYTPVRPTENDYIALLEELWWESIYVAKNLARGELLPAKYGGECVLRFRCLVRMLEWYVQIDSGWTRKVGPHGRHLVDYLSPMEREALDATFAGAGTGENWDALFAATRLFRHAALKVADDLGYRYPEAIDREAEVYLTDLRSRAEERP